VTNGAIVTVNVDGLGAKPLRVSPGVELGAGVLVQGSPYVITYVNADGAFYLQNFFGNPFNIPIGGLMPYVGATAPNSNFVLPFGQAISRTTYAGLFALTSTTFGAGDGTTTFNVPDLRGRSIFGQDNMGGSAASRITVAGGNFNGTTLGATGGAENHTLTIGQMPSHDQGGVTGTTTSSLGNLTGNSGGISSPGASRIQLSGINADQIVNLPAIGAGFNQGSAAISAQGGGSAFTILPPAMTMPYILRVI
jgi:microcystin-dependent protein